MRRPALRRRQKARGWCGMSATDGSGAYIATSGHRRCSGIRI
jgi:hypothetical protein